LKEVLATRETQSADYASVLGDARDFVSSGLDRVHDHMEAVATQRAGPSVGYMQDFAHPPGKRIRSTFLLLLARR